MSSLDVPSTHDLSAAGADAYDVRERIAVGAAAIVYRAMHRSSGRKVLFKVLQDAEITNPLNVGQVLANKHRLAAVRHPNVAELIEVIEDEEGCVLVYSYLAGKGANRCPSERDFAPEQCMEIARQLCAALVAGEQAHVPHGELKPSNIVISRGSEAHNPVQVQVQDWGLAACRLGVPPYESLLFMAPERLSGRGPSFSSDLFSLGATLVFLFTGHLPVQGGSTEDLRCAWQNFNAADIGLHRPDLEPFLVEWLGWLLQYHPAARPATAAQAALALHSGRIPQPSPGPRSVCSAGPATQPLPRHTPTASGSPTVPLSKPATRPTPNLAGQRLLSGAFYVSFVLASIAVALCVLEFHFGSGWVANQIQEWRTQKALAKVSSKQDPLGAALSASAESPPFAGAIQVARPAPLLLSERFGYALDANLNLENGGQGWTTAWNADNVVIGKTPTDPRLFAMMGASAESHARRGLGSSRLLLNGHTLALGMSLWFPLEDGPTLTVDLLDGCSESAPIRIIPEASRVRVSIVGGEGEIDVPVGHLWRLTVAYSVSRTTSEAVNIDITAMANADLRTGHASPYRMCRRTLTNVYLPESLWLNLRTEGAAPQDCKVSDLRVSSSLREALYDGARH